MADAREQMIAAAERIGAEQGFGAMSLRAVQQAAGQRNKSAAQYHFGSREGLIEAVLATRMGPINDRRIQALLALDGPGTVRDLAEVLVLPLADAVFTEATSCWARFAMAGYADPSVVAAIQTSLEGEAFRIVRDRLLAHLDHLPAAIRTRRFDQALGLVFLGLAAAETQQAKGIGEPIEAAVIVADLLDVFVGALTAPTTAPAPASAP